MDITRSNYCPPWDSNPLPRAYQSCLLATILKRLKHAAVAFYVKIYFPFFAISYTVYTIIHSEFGFKSLVNSG